MPANLTQTTIHFAHANGFPAGSYKKLFSLLDDSRVLALEKFAHNPGFPIVKDWRGQVDELCAYLSSETSEPVFGVGHSFGAIITYMAACNRPELFRGLILLDPPLITGVTRHVVKLLRKTPLMDHVTPANKAITRCTQWPEGTNMVEYFSQKALFKDMDVQCIEDYVSSAIEERESGFGLTFDHMAEAQLFRTIPTNIHKFYGKLPLPGLLITGQGSRVCTTSNIRPFVKHNNFKHAVIENGGHMFPLEQPENVAHLINQQISAWLK